MANAVKYPGPGCIVEYMEDNAVRIAMILEESSGKMRLLTPNRRETRLAPNRLLPWPGPQYPGVTGKDDATRLLEQHKKTREARQAAIDPAEVWELAQGEIESASAAWFADLFENDADADTVAAYGRALLSARSLFRFQPPEFVVYDAETVARRQAEQKAREEKEALVDGGAAFLRMLWEQAMQRKAASPEDCARLSPGVQERIETLLRARVSDPESTLDDALWQLLRKSLPDVPHLPLQLLIAWGKLPRHYNYLLDRAAYDAGDNWWQEAADEVSALADAARNPEPTSDGGLNALPFISIDSSSTRDIDDAFYIEPAGDGYRVVIALASPAWRWQPGGSLDRLVLHRATSIYLPEGNLHMLPECLGIDAYSLWADSLRPAFCLEFLLDARGEILEMTPRAAQVRLAANLHYEDVQKVLSGQASDTNPARQHDAQLELADSLARKREQTRISHGAVVLLRPETAIRLVQAEDDVIVEIETEPETPDAQRLVTEMMVLASAAIADWARDNSVSLIHRTQNVTIPPEYAGIWDRPEDLARVLHVLAPSVLEVTPRPHAALGAPRYAPITSPLRRYADLVNEIQILHYLSHGAPRWSDEELERLLTSFTPALEAASRVQRFWPRYWRLQYFRQQGDQRWWTATITEENENFVSLSLPEKGLSVRGRRQLFDERAYPGMPVQVRLGKINPLYNDIQILETMPGE